MSPKNDDQDHWMPVPPACSSSLLSLSSDHRCTVIITTWCWSNCLVCFVIDAIHTGPWNTKSEKGTLPGNGDQDQRCQCLQPVRLRCCLCPPAWMAHPEQTGCSDAVSSLVACLLCQSQCQCSVNLQVADFWNFPEPNCKMWSGNSVPGLTAVCTESQQCLAIMMSLHDVQ